MLTSIVCLLCACASVAMTTAATYNDDPIVPFPPSDRDDVIMHRSSRRVIPRTLGRMIGRRSTGNSDDVTAIDDQRSRRAARTAGSGGHQTWSSFVRIGRRAADSSDDLRQLTPSDMDVIGNPDYYNTHDAASASRQFSSSSHQLQRRGPSSFIRIGRRPTQDDDEDELNRARLLFQIEDSSSYRRRCNDEVDPMTRRRCWTEARTAERQPLNDNEVDEQKPVAARRGYSSFVRIGRAAADVDNKSSATADKAVDSQTKIRV